MNTSFLPSAITLNQLVETAKTNLSLCPSSVLHEITKFEVKVIHTLGPALTSSHLTAIKFLENTPNQIKVILHDTFEDILRLSVSETDALALLPSAYADVNKFFMHKHFKLVGCFCSDTPPYHIAWSKKRTNPLLTDNNKPMKIATHPAPADLISRLLPNNLEYIEKLYHSTTSSAYATIDGEADMALCNLETINKLDLNYSSKGVVINMTWNLFALSSKFSDI